MWLMKDIVGVTITVNLVKWLKDQIKNYKQQEIEEWKIQQLPEQCQQCELLGICRDKEHDWKCRHACMVL